MSAASVVTSPPATAGLPLGGASDTSPDNEKSEGKVVDYEPFLPDQKYHKTSPPEYLTLTEEQDAIYQEVLKHFATEGYVIPDLRDEDGTLTEEERFYLVSPPLSSFSQFIGGAEDSNRCQTYECFLRCSRRRCARNATV